MPLEIVTVPRVPCLRTGHYDLESGPADFAIEHLHAAVAALANDPAVLPLRVRLEIDDQGHDLGGVAAEAAGGSAGPVVGWGDNYAVTGNTLYADLHIPAVIAENMQWAFPGRSIEGVHGYTTATGQRHDFMATGLLLLGQSWPGVSTLPDFAEVQAEFAADVAAGTITVPSYATASLLPPGRAQPGGVPPTRAVLQASAVCARLGATGRPPERTRQDFAAAGLNVADLRLRWYAAEGDGTLTESLPESYSYFDWYVTEVRVNDDGGLAVIVLDEATAQEWSFAVESVSGGQVTFAAPVEVVRPDPVPVTATTARPRPPVARFASRADSRAGASSPASPHPNQEDDPPMNDALRRRLAERHGLDPETATEDEVTTAELAATEADPPEDPEGAPEGDQEPAGVTARTRTYSAARAAELEAQAAAGAAAHVRQVHGDNDRLVLAAISTGRILPAESGLGTPDPATGLYTVEDGWRRDLDEAPEVTRRALARLQPGKYPGTSGATATVPAADSGSMTRVRAAMGLTNRKRGD